MSCGSCNMQIMQELTTELNAVPRLVFWTDSYPKTASGKIQKFLLREEGIRLAKEGKGSR